MNESLINKKSWLDYLFYKIGKQKYNFFVCGTYGDKQFSKWKTYLDSVARIDIVDYGKNNWKDANYFEQINQRQILPNEVVLDLEEPELLDEILYKLSFGNYVYYLYSTGSRGYHVHLFLDKELTSKQKLAVIKYFGTDEQKSIDKNLIALENSPHWKTGKLKVEVLHGN